MKKKLKFIFILVLAFVTFLSFLTTAYAEFLGGKIVGGAENILYWRDSSIYEYRQSVDYGFGYWNGHLSTVSLARTNTKSYSRCDVYWGAYFPPGSDIFAQTFLIFNNIVLVEDQNGKYHSDWYWCQVKFNQYMYNYTECSDYAVRKAIACHEYGHFLGLAHPIPYIYVSIMQKTFLRTTNVPEYYDFNQLEMLYGE